MKSYFDIVGDGGSGILEQVAVQHETRVQNLSGVGTLLAVGSGKGGVGKSTLTMQLACALRELGNRVSILDADLNGPSQARLGALPAGMLVPGEHGVPVPLTQNGIGIVSMGSLVPEPRAIEFDSVAIGESHTWRATREFTLLRELLASMEWGQLDYLLVDLPPGAERIVQYAELLGRETRFVLVTLPSDLATGVVARSVDALRKTPNQILGYVRNMDGYFCADCDEVKALFPIGSEVKLDLPCLGSVPFDPELAARCDRGGSASEVPAGVSWQPVRRIAEEILQRVAEPLSISEEKT